MLKLQTQWENRNKLYAEGYKLYAEGYKLRAEGDIQWFATVIASYGNVPVIWKNNNCIIEGDEYIG